MATDKPLAEQRKDLVKQVVADLQVSLSDDDALTRAIKLAVPLLKSAHQLSSAIRVAAQLRAELEAIAEE